MAGLSGSGQFIEVISPPAGEAPAWVRAKWVGLRLPVAPRRAKPLRFLATGVLTGPRNPLAALVGLFLGRYHRERGYAVPVLAALEVLERAHPDAARWWSDNAAHLVRPGRFFLFSESACRIVGDTDPSGAGPSTRTRA